MPNGRPKGSHKLFCGRGHLHLPENRTAGGACRLCRRIQKKAYKKAHPAIERERKRRYYKKYPEKSRERAQRRRRKNPERVREYARLWRSERPGYYRVYHRKVRINMRERIHQYLLSHPCVDCGETDIVVLEFDHRDPAERTCSVHKCASLRTLEIEIDKCDVRCGNCHTRRHYYERMNKKILTPPSDSRTLETS
jgi:hypothetical protein